MVDVTVTEGTGYVAEPLWISDCVWLFPEFPEKTSALYSRLRMESGSRGTGVGTLIGFLLYLSHNESICTL